MIPLLWVWRLTFNEQSKVRVTDVTRVIKPLWLPFFFFLRKTACLAGLAQ